jgi:hypothetical protein
LHRKTGTVKATHLCYDIVKECEYEERGLIQEEVTMPAIAEIPSTALPHSARRGTDRPACPVCADTMIATEASAYMSENVIGHLWSCDTCGYGFVTKHVVAQRIVCN